MVKLMVNIIGALLLVLLQIGFLFVLLGMLPSIVARFVDHSPQRTVFKTVFASNLAGMVPFLTTMIMRHGDSATLQSIMMNPTSWLVVYACAAAGWMLVWICQYMAYLWISITYQGELMMLEASQRKLIEEWGPQVKRRDAQA